MSTESMSPQQEYDFYADAANQKPQSGPRRRKPSTPQRAPVPVRFPADLLEDVKNAAQADDPSSTNCAAAPDLFPVG